MHPPFVTILTAFDLQFLEAEFAKQIRKPPVVEFMIPKRIFLPQDPASGVEDNLLTRIWGFE